MSLLERQVYMVNMLLYVGNVTVTELANYFSVSRKTIYTDLDLLCYWLGKNNIGKLVKANSGRYSIVASDTDLIEKLLFQELQVFRSYEIPERQAFLLFWLITNPLVNIGHLLNKLEVSRNTLITDLRYIRQLFEQKMIYFRYIPNGEGYCFFGDELEVRATLINFLGPYARKLIYAGILSVADIPVNGVISPSARDWLAISFYIQACRRKGGYILNADDFSNDCIAALGYDQIASYEEFYSNCLLGGLTAIAKDRRVERLCEQATLTFLQALTSLTTNKVDISVKKVIARHLYSAFYRAGVGIVLKNPVLDAIESKYSNIFRIVKFTISNIFPMTVCESFKLHEASYLTALFVSHCRREYEAEEGIVVACYEKTSTAYSIKEQLIDLGVDGKRIKFMVFEQIKEEIPFLITMTPLPDAVKAKKWIRVSPHFSVLERSRLRYELGNYITKCDSLLQDVVKKHVSPKKYQAIMLEVNKITMGGKYVLQDLLTRDMIKIIDSVPCWEEALNIVAQNLLDKNKITYQYLIDVKDNIHKNGAYVVLRNEFALPHARPQEAVRETSMSLLILKNEVLFARENVPVKVIVMLAAKDSDSHLDALAELIYLVSDEGRFEQIKQAQNVEEVVKLIKEVGV